VTDLAPVAGKLASFIRLLASDKDGEVVAAARAMFRTLQGIGADFHCLAERVERSDGDLSEAEMERVYTAGIEEGRRLEKQQRASQQHNGYSPPQFPAPRDMALHCYRNIDELNSEWEREFVTNMMSWTRSLRPLSPKQRLHLEKVYIKAGGRI
jgi:hypothetical protein